MKICGIRFKSNGKTYYFKDEDINVGKDDYVIVETEKGEQYGKVIIDDVNDIKYIDKDKMKFILRKATLDDTKKYEKNLKDSLHALEYAKATARENDINMRLIDASFTLDRKQLTFNFVADERVDFRILVKELAAKYKTRIELHQIGVRDKSKEVGGIGACGRPLCCSSFLNGIETISINMAKNQNIALNPTKINGVCGRLLCCLAYEDEVYYEHRKELPKMGESVKTKIGVGKVVSLDVLNKKYTLDIDGERHEFEI